MNRFTELLAVLESVASNSSIYLSGKRRETVIDALRVAGTPSTLGITKRALAYAQIIVTIWANWNDDNEDIMDDALRVTCEAVRALDMHQVEGVIASPLNYFVRAYLDEDNAEDLTYSEMMDSMSVSIGLLCAS